MGNGLILVAASGLALETAEAARAAGLEVAGCVDDDAARWGGSAGGWLPILGALDLVVKHSDLRLVICAGRGVVRERIFGRLRALGVPDDRYATVVHPSVTVPPSCEVGAGSVVLAGAVLTATVTVRRHVVVMPNVTLTHDDVVDDFATLCAGATLGGAVRIGRAAYVGMAASVREEVSVGAAATLGMGAVLLRDLPPGQTWAGVPARPLSHNA
ncbi:NeuD/PglB/VioB family sugar acetyltransferase [Pedococcus sp. KACC 23699]|uniref:NeuD/PglB/VioB family sugar acetyltransferase n=1 Tax=Pedococcus sp. KACC 23699 TaxID=3149228 RepID=A0AAU7JXC1_9MICO